MTVHALLGHISPSCYPTDPAVFLVVLPCTPLLSRVFGGARNLYLQRDVSRSQRDVFCIPIVTQHSSSAQHFDFNPFLRRLRKYPSLLTLLEDSS